MNAAAPATALEAPTLAEFRREIRRLHGCSARFERFVVVPEAPGRGRRAVAVFLLDGHPAAHRCYVWPEADGLVAVLHGIDIRGPEDAVRHVAAVERSLEDRWTQTRREGASGAVEAPGAPSPHLGYEQPLVAPQVRHFRHVPLRTSVNWPHSEHGSPS